MQQELVVLKQTTLCKSLVLQDFPKVEWMSSIDGIRTYKRVSNEQKEDISHVLNSATNGDILPQPKKLKLEQSHLQNPRHNHTCSKSTSCHHQLDKLLLHYNKLHKETPARIQTLFILYIHTTQDLGLHSSYKGKNASLKTRTIEACSHICCTR